MKLAAFLSVSVLASASAFAAATTSSVNTFGILRVDSSAMRTIVAVPWVAAGVDNGEIKVVDIVKTANLQENDVLRYYKADGSFDNWRLGVVEGIKVWQTVNQVSQNGGGDPSPDPSLNGLPRGGAIILERGTGRANCFYLQGQVGSGTIAGPTITHGAATTPVYNLIAPPNVSNETSIDLSTGITWGGVGSADRIFIYLASGETKECVYRDTGSSVYKWQYSTDESDPAKSGWDKTVWHDATVPVGTGFWYVSRTATAPTITWK